MRAARRRWWLLAGALVVAGLPEAALADPTAPTEDAPLRHGKKGRARRAADAKLDEAYRLRASGDRAGARAAFVEAGHLGADNQRVALELAYIAIDDGQPDEARRLHVTASKGPDAELARRAREQRAAMKPQGAPGSRALDEAYAAKRDGDLVAAAAAFQRARQEGALVQLVELELGYLAAASGDGHAATRHFRAAAKGGDASLAGKARDELKAMHPGKQAAEAP